MAVVGLIIQQQTRVVSDFTILFWFYAFGSLLLVPIALAKGVLFDAHAPFSLQLARAVTSVLQIALFFLALRSIPLVDAILLRAAAPVWVPLLLRLFWKQRIPGPTMLLIGVGFVGIALILHPVRSELTIGYAYGLFAGVSFAFQNILNRRLVELQEPMLRTLTLLFVLGWLMCALPAPWTWQMPTPETIAMLALASVGGALSTALVVHGFGFAPTHILAPFLYVSVIVSAGLDWILHDHVPDLSTIVGCGIVIAVCILLARGNKPHAIASH